MATLTDKEEAFCRAYALNGGNATDAWRSVNPNSKAKLETQYSKASIMLAQEKVKARISELKDKARAKADEKFFITVEQRLKWLKEIAEAGIGTYLDQGGNERRENLAAARAAIATMNDMLGTDGDNHQSHQGVTIVIKRDDGKL